MERSEKVVKDEEELVWLHLASVFSKQLGHIHVLKTNKMRYSYEEKLDWLHLASIFSKQLGHIQVLKTNKMQFSYETKTWSQIAKNPKK